MASVSTWERFERQELRRRERRTRHYRPGDRPDHTSVLKLIEEKRRIRR